MLKRLKKALQQRETKIPSEKDCSNQCVKYENDLLSGDRAHIITKIKRLVSATEQIWNNHYLFAIRQFSSYVQSLPASKLHHHSYDGGLLDHTLEMLLFGLTSAQGYILPPNSAPEDIVAASEKWHFGVFIALLAHDFGKIVTDVEVVYREQGGEWQRWLPWFGVMPVGAEYQARFGQRIENSAIGKSLHESVAVSMVSTLLTKKAALWLFSDRELVAQVVGAITNAQYPGLVISEIVRSADKASVAQNLGADPTAMKDTSSSASIEMKILTAIRFLAESGKFKRNRPGAALWVTDQYTWLVSKAGIEAVQFHLTNEGHKGIPKSVTRIFEILGDHNFIKKRDNQDLIWRMEIQDHAHNWTQTLTFLCFDNAMLWPNNSTPTLFDGTFINTSDNTLTIPQNSSTVQRHSAIETTQHQKHDKEEETDEKSFQSTEVVQQSAIKELKTKSDTDKSRDAGQVDTLAPPIKLPRLKQIERRSANLDDDEFFSWLLRGIHRYDIRVNEPKAPVHILDDRVVLVTPAIFILYLKQNPVKKRFYMKESSGKKDYTLVQQDVEAHNINAKSEKGENIFNISVIGKTKQSTLKAYLIDINHFPSLRKFPSNKALSLEQ